MNLRVKIRSLIVNRVNEFHATDILNIVEFLLGLAQFLLWLWLFTKKFDSGDFKVVLSDEREFDRWVVWSYRFNAYRVILGV